MLIMDDAPVSRVYWDLPQNRPKTRDRHRVRIAQTRVEEDGVLAPQVYKGADVARLVFEGVCELEEFIRRPYRQDIVLRPAAR